MTDDKYSQRLEGLFSEKDVLAPDPQSVEASPDERSAEIEELESLRARLAEFEAAAAQETVAAKEAGAEKGVLPLSGQSAPLRLADADELEQVSSPEVDISPDQEQHVSWRSRILSNPFRTISGQLNVVAFMAIFLVANFAAIVILVGNLNNLAIEVSQLYEHNNVLRDLQRHLENTSVGLEEIVTDANLDNVGVTLVETESILSSFSTYKSVAEELGLRIEYGFSVENEPVVLAIRNDVFDSISWARKGDYWQARLIKEKIDFNIGHIGVFVKATSDLRQAAISEKFAEMENLRNLYGNLVIGVGIFMALLSAGGNIGIGRSLTRRLRELTSTSEQFAAGNLDTRASLGRGDEIGNLADAFNRMAAGLQQSQADIQERAMALEISGEVSRRLSTIIDVDRLVSEVVEQLRSAFGFYHAHIYLFDENKTDLRMVGGTGQAGQAMLAQGHTILVGQGLVGRAAKTNQVVLVPDVSQEEGWLPNPLLPETEAEVAVPIAAGEEVLGVLDVQHNILGGLSPMNAELIQAIASQVAIALRNIAAYDTAQKQAQREALIGNITGRIHGTTSVEDALRVTVRELSLALNTDTFVRLESVESGNTDG